MNFHEALSRTYILKKNSSSIATQVLELFWSSQSVRKTDGASYSNGFVGGTWITWSWASIAVTAAAASTWEEMHDSWKSWVVTVDTLSSWLSPLSKLPFKALCLKSKALQLVPKTLAGWKPWVGGCCGRFAWLWLKSESEWSTDANLIERICTCHHHSCHNTWESQIVPFRSLAKRMFTWMCHDQVLSETLEYIPSSWLSFLDCYKHHELLHLDYPCTYLNLALEQLHIVDDFVQHHCLPCHLQISRRMDHQISVLALKKFITLDS